MNGTWVTTSGICCNLNGRRETERGGRKGERKKENNQLENGFRGWIFFLTLYISEFRN